MKNGRDICCSNHFYKRCKERLGLNKKASLSLLQKAVENGLSFKDITGLKHVRSYIYKHVVKSAHMRKNKEFRIHNHNVFIIAYSGNTIVGVTVERLPPDICVLVDEIYNKRKERLANGYGTVTS